MADAPKPGQLVEHHFLWSAEWEIGRREGRKRRSCLIIAVEDRKARSPLVTVLPVTSQPPRAGAETLAIPNDIKKRIGLDIRRDAWIVVSEANVFGWPGFDLVPRKDGGYILGTVTRGFFARVRETVLRLHARGLPRRVNRDDP